MLGSLPMSLKEVAMAPALISSLVKRRGYAFDFIDINLELFEKCQRDHARYQEKIEVLQNMQDEPKDELILQWQDSVLERLADSSYLVVNVFSHYSQSTALLFVKQVRQQLPDMIILMGGIGSQKNITNADNQQIRDWINKNFKHSQSLIFGQLLLDNGLIDSWQSDTTTSELEKILDTRLISQAPVPDIDFTVYRLDDYAWEGRRYLPMLGSYGCVRQCSFCDVIKHFPSYSFVEADRLSQDIVQVYQQTGISKFAFMDSLVNGSMSNFESMLQNLAHSRQQGWLPEDFSWSGSYICRSKSTQLDRIHALLADSGCEILVIGVETGSDRVRWDMDKKFTNQDLLYELDAFARHSKVDAFARRSIKTELLFFPAWPTETLEDFDQTQQLFAQLGPFAQQGTVESVALGTTGFSLIDGTPIDKDRDRIGLEPGPTTFLWKCKQNPDLNFWEAIRRRLLIADVAQHHGITLGSETVFRRYLYLNLLRHRQIILDYVGALPNDIFNFGAVMNGLPHTHRLQFEIVNSGPRPVILTVNNQPLTCQYGVSFHEIVLDKPFDQAIKVDMRFEFDRNYEPVLATHENGDYYSKNGVYLQRIKLDHRDITFWGFNQITDQTMKNTERLPEDFDQHNNKRCVISDATLTWNVPGGVGLQAWILQTLNSQEHQERLAVDQRLNKELDWYRQN